MDSIYPKRHPALLIIIFLGFFIGALLISQFLMMLILYPFLGNNVMTLGNVIQNPNAYPDYQYVILFVQGFTSFCAMVVAPLIFIRYFFEGKLNFFKNVPAEIFFLSTGLLVIISMPANAWIADLNLQIDMPDVFESWAAEKEKELKVLTEYMTNFKTNTEFFIGLIVIALIPAIGEELMFRGIIQTSLKDWLKNNHAAIWISAIIFSAIHMQFYGFFPRLFLGVLFGYLFAWTGNMLIPITGHFVNNGFTLFLLYMKNLGKLKIDVESTKEIPTGLIIGSAVIFIGMFVAFWFQFKNSVKKASNEVSKY